MKSLITSAAGLAVLLAFLLQFTQFQVLYNRIVSVDQSVNAFKEVVKQEGCITAGNEASLKQEISRNTACSPEEIRVSGDSDRIQRGSRIHYRVSVPMPDMIGLKGFTYTIDRYTTSEYIGGTS